MIDTLVPIMGEWGVRALIVWATALTVLVFGSFLRARPKAYWFALMLALAAGYCAHKNLNVWYASIRLDRTDEINAALASRAPQEGLATTVRFAEDDPEDRVEGGVIRVAAVPHWREGGPKARGGGARTNEVAEIGDDGMPIDPAAGEGAVIYMKGDQLSIVRQLERGNRLAINTLTLLILLAMLYDYTTAFNSVRSTRLALPLSGALIDSLSPKSRALVIRPDVGKRWRPEPFLSRSVRKGENVVYFGQTPIWHGRTSLPRLSLAGLPLWQVSILRYGAPHEPQGSEFAFDAAWFGRYVVTVIGDTLCREMLEDFVDILQERRRSGARARRTLVIAWDRDEELEKAFLVKLAKLADEANLSLFVWTRASAAR